MSWKPYHPHRLQIHDFIAALAMAIGFPIFVALFVSGCQTPQQTTYGTLATAAETLKVTTAAWDAYVHQALAAHSVRLDTLKTQNDAVASAESKAKSVLNIAIDAAGDLKAPATADVAAAVSDLANLVASFKK